MAGIWRYTVKFDIALALQLRSQNVLLIAEALSDIEDMTWKVIKVVSGECHLLYSNCPGLSSINYSSDPHGTYNVNLHYLTTLPYGYVNPVNV